MYEVPHHTAPGHNVQPPHAFNNVVPARLVALFAVHAAVPHIPRARIPPPASCIPHPAPRTPRHIAPRTNPFKRTCTSGSPSGPQRRGARFNRPGGSTPLFLLTLTWWMVGWWVNAGGYLGRGAMQVESTVYVQQRVHSRERKGQRSCTQSKHSLRLYPARSRPGLGKAYVGHTTQPYKPCCGAVVP